MGFLKFISGIVSDGTYTDKKGYLRYKDTNKLVHREEAEEKLGRKLRDGEVVHHKDRDKQNNSEENLWVFKSQADHDKAHKKDAKKHGKASSYQGFKKKKKGFWDLF